MSEKLEIGDGCMLQTKQTATVSPERAEAQVLHKKIGSTTYVVGISFSATSRETLEDKVLRLIERGALSYA